MSTFVAVVDAQGFAGAARKMQVSPPAVTRAISELEAMLGVQLLTRTTRVVRVTDAGAQYVEDCRRILAEADEADEAAKGTNLVVRGHLIVTAPVLFGRTFVMPIVTKYLEANAQTSVACWFMDRVVHMTDEGVDVAIRIGVLPDSSLHAIRVGQVRHVVCACPDYLKRHAKLSHPNDLASHTIISSSTVTSKAEWKFSAPSGPFDVIVRPRLMSTTNDAAIAAALGGFGITRLMSYQVAPYIERGDLTPILVEFEPPAVPVHVVHREGRRASKKVRSFVDMAVAQLSGNPLISLESTPGDQLAKSPRGWRASDELAAQLASSN